MKRSRSAEQPESTSYDHYHAMGNRPPAPAGWGYDWRGQLVDLRGLRPGEDGRDYFQFPRGREIEIT